MFELSDIANMWIRTASYMVGMGILFTIAARLWPCNPGMAWWQDRRAAVTDLFYWFVCPVILRMFRLMMAVGMAAMIIGMDDADKLGDFFLNGYGPLSQLPLWLQVAIVLVISDVMLYWTHRIYHTDIGWKFHAVHHSPKVLDWMSTQRFHPVNLILGSVAVDVLLLSCGFSPMAFVILAPFNIVYSAFVHANLNWTLGPFKRVLASPVFHRWHHTSVARGGMKNFAPTFPILDVIFGTFYMPEGELPDGYGVSDKEFPEDFWGQLAYPFIPKQAAVEKAESRTDAHSAT